MSSWVKILLILLGITLMVLIGMCNKDTYKKEWIPMRDSSSIDTIRIRTRANILNK